MRDFVWNKLPIRLHDLGEHALKNISRPVRTYRVTPGSGQGNGHGDSAAPGIQPHLTWDNRPTIAVLPFRSEGSEADPYFGDGTTEEIITSLSMNRSLFVIARNSTLKYRGHLTSASDVAAELGVRFLLEGSVQRRGKRLRINAGLIDASRNRELWAEHYDGEDEDLFTFQDQIAVSIAAAIDPRLQEAEIARVRERPTDSFGAYDCALRGLSVLYKAVQLQFRGLHQAGRRHVPPRHRTRPALRPGPCPPGLVAQPALWRRLQQQPGSGPAAGR